ncbi:MAG: PilN domain-containing protein [Desulfobulbaceae bacterium]|nr:PilN domain-containing protein [Desulfobulbaceae bacterium]
MIRINLLPVRDIKRRNKVKKELFAAARVVVFILILLAMAGIWKTATVKNLRSELADLQANKKQHNAYLKEIESLEKENELLLNRIAVIEQLKQSSAVTVRILDDVARRTPPDRIWLTGLAQTGNQVQIGGISLDNQTVAKYMVDLEGSPFLQNLVLVKSDMKRYADRDLKAFTITSSIVVPEEQHLTPAAVQ